jgi:hypothetical protein
MWAIITFGVGLLVVAATMGLWWLLSAFGCEMNTAGCSRVRLDTSPDALRIFLPMLGVGAATMAVGLWMRYRRRAGHD